MTVAPKKYAWLYALLPVIGGNITLLILSRFSFDFVSSIIAYVIPVNLIAIYFLIKEYKTFSLQGRLLKVSNTYIPFIRGFTFETQNVTKIEIVQWTFEGREIPKFILYTKNGKKKKLGFRMSSQKEIFQEFINQLKAKGVEVISIGGFWL